MVGGILAAGADDEPFGHAAVDAVAAAVAVVVGVAAAADNRQLDHVDVDEDAAGAVPCSAVRRFAGFGLGPYGSQRQ